MRPLLREDVRPIKFVLCKRILNNNHNYVDSPACLDQSPPKRELKVSDLSVRDLSLSQLHLAPSSILYVRFEDDSLNGNNSILVCLPAVLNGSTS